LICARIKLRKARLLILKPNRNLAAPYFGLMARYIRQKWHGLCINHLKSPLMFWRGYKGKVVNGKSKRNVLRSGSKPFSLESILGLPDIISNYISAYNQLDVSAMLACLTDDVEFQNISDGTIDTHTSSKDEFKKLANMGVAAFESREQTVLHTISVSHITLVEINYQAVVKMDLPNGWKAGQELQFSGASAFEITDGKISKIIDQS
jgi:hypothetical protein